MKQIFAFSALALATSATALTFNDDGSIVNSDGTQVQAPAAERYAEALEAFRNGEKVSGFPTAKKSSFFGIETIQPAPKGYFGQAIVENGAPLFPLPPPSQLDAGDPVASIAENLGMSSDQFTSALVSSADEGWLEDNGIPPEAVAAFDANVDEFLETVETIEQLQEQGIEALNAATIDIESIQAGDLDALIQSAEAALVNPPPAVAMALQSRATELNLLDAGFTAPAIDFVDLSGEVGTAAEQAAAAAQEIEKLAAEGIRGVDGTALTVADIANGVLDDTIGQEFALVGATEEVFAAYESRLTQSLAEEAGISVTELDFINTAVLEAGVSSAAEASVVAAQAAQAFQQRGGETQILAEQAREAADQANAVFEAAQREALRVGTDEAFAQAEQALAAAQQAADAARIAGEAAAAAGEAGIAAANQASQEALQQQIQAELGNDVAAIAASEAYAAAEKAALAAGESVQAAAEQAAQAAAEAGRAAAQEAAADAAQQAAQVAASDAAQQAAQQAAEGAASEAAQAAAQAAANDAAVYAAQQAALGELEQALENGQITEAQFQEAIQGI